MANLKFADTHNLVVFSKPTESEGFEQIVDFLNANLIRYALMINPTIYILCIEQFWSTIKAKTVNSTIFEQLTLMGYKKILQKLTFYKAFFSPQWKFLIHTILQCLSSKTTAWNDFNSTMASAIICLATNQKFNFSKYIFESMVKNLDNVGKFLMYPRFIQVFLDKQLKGMPTHNRIYIAPSHTKKIFENMRRVGKGFFGRETPLFQTMEVQDQAEMGEEKNRKPKRKDTQIPQSSGPTEHVADEAVYKELDDSLVRAATTASSLEAEQDSGGGPRRQETMGDNIAQTRFENVSKHSNDPLLVRAMVESYEDEESLGDDASKQGRINAIDVNEDITLVNDPDDADMFDVNTLTGDEVLAEQEVATKDVNLTVDEVTLAQALATLKSVKPKVKSNVVKEPSVPVSAASTKFTAATTTTTATIPNPRKEIIITELEPKKPLKKKDQISFDEQEAIRLQDKFDEEERLARDKDGANVALTEEWDDIQAKVDADYQLAQRLQAKEQEQFTTKQKATLFKELLEQRRKHFADKRAEEKRNKPPTKTQQKKTMITYIKNMEGWKHKYLKSKDFDSIKELFDKAFKRVNMFMDYRTNLVEGSSKRAGDELEQEVTKKQKVDDVQETAEVDDDQEAAKIKELMEIVPNEEEVAIDAIPLATKPPTIIDWKIHKEGKKNYYQIIRADGSSKMYLVFSHMLKSFDREDFKTLWKLVKAKYGSKRPVEDLDLILWGYLKTMFEPHIEDRV
ncbi:hypothetical protein Tco_0979366 [Tanacetum coccineum]